MTTDPGEHEKDRNPSVDLLTDVQRPDHDEDIDAEKEIASAELERDADPLDKAGAGDDAESIEQREELARLRSYATNTSATTAATSRHPPVQRKWYKTPNPLRWGRIPDVPEEKTVCPEYKAGFFNKLIFYWQGPLMSVRQSIAEI